MYGNAVVPVLHPGRGSIHAPSTALLDPFFSYHFPFSISNTLNKKTFASFIRGQPPARHAKVVDNGLCPLKTGSTRFVCPSLCE